MSKTNEYCVYQTEEGQANMKPRESFPTGRKIAAHAKRTLSNTI